MSERLPQLMDSRMIQTETGLPEPSVRVIMQRLPKIHLAGVRKTWVRRSDFWDAFEEIRVQSGGGR